MSARPHPTGAATSADANVVQPEDRPPVFVVARSVTSDLCKAFRTGTSAAHLRQTNSNVSWERSKKLLLNLPAFGRKLETNPLDYRKLVWLWGSGAVDIAKESGVHLQVPQLGNNSLDLMRAFKRLLESEAHAAASPVASSVEEEELDGVLRGIHTVLRHQLQSTPRQVSSGREARQRTSSDESDSGYSEAHDGPPLPPRDGESDADSASGDTGKDPGNNTSEPQLPVAIAQSLNNMGGSSAAPVVEKPTVALKPPTEFVPSSYFAKLLKQVQDGWLAPTQAQIEKDLTRSECTEDLQAQLRVVLQCYCIRAPVVGCVRSTYRALYTPVYNVS